MKKILLFIIAVLALIIIFGAINSKSQNIPATLEPSTTPLATTFTPEPIVESTRSFYMGFSTWPPDMNVDSIIRGFALSNQNSDIRLVQLDAGVPWPGMSAGKAVPKRITDSWQSTKDNIKGKKLFVSITPFNFDRSDISLLASDKGDNQPLPAEWKNLGMNNEKVKQAYLNYAEAVVNFWQPDYLAISIEANVSINLNFKQWTEYLDLHQYVYEKLKAKHPQLPVFATIQVEHFKGITEDSKGKLPLQITELGKLMKYSDITALSVYPYSVKDGKFTSDYFDVFKQYGKPLAISETGWPTQTYTVFGYSTQGSKDAQAEYLQSLFKVLNDNKFVFMINWVNVDYTKLLAKLPKSTITEFSNTWVYNGLWDENFNEKPALAVWKQYFSLPRR